MPQKLNRQEKKIIQSQSEYFTIFIYLLVVSHLFSVVQMLGTAQSLKILESSKPDDSEMLELVARANKLNPIIDNVSMP
jgi:hypothetical protein